MCSFCSWSLGDESVTSLTAQSLIWLSCCDTVLWRSFGTRSGLLNFFLMCQFILKQLRLTSDCFDTIWLTYLLILWLSFSYHCCSKCSCKSTKLQFLGLSLSVLVTVPPCAPPHHESPPQRSWSVNNVCTRSGYRMRYPWVMQFFLINLLSYQCCTIFSRCF